MNKILGKAAQASPLAPVQTPLLSKHHEEFSESSEEWQTRETEKVALLQVLSLQKCRCVFLVSDRDRDVSPILVNLTRTLSEPSKCPTSLKGRVIFNLVSLKPTERRKTEVLQLWESLFEEAAGANKAILYVPPIESGHNRDAIRDWLGLLKEALRKGAFQCVGRVSQDAYRECIKTDAAWKRLSHAMRIQRETKLELPQEL
jgi:ATP-dependent Clp protease ATP-binding subunit ClpA